jgi:histidinol dehydrogenase
MTAGVLVLAELDPAARARLGNRAEGLMDDATAAVRPVLERIRRDGDAAVLAFLREVDGVELTADRLIVEPAVVDAAAASIPAELVAAMAHTARNLERYHRAQLLDEFAIEVEPGVVVGERFPAVRAAGCYVPFGTAIYPSSALMLTVPARVAGVERIVLASGIDPATGEIPAAVLAAAALGGATEIWRVSGTAAVAAWAYGTETLRPVDVIAGPGGPYVAAAKELVRHHVGIDLEAGPSEVLVLALDDFDPDLAAADLISEGEHGATSCGLVVTPDAARAADTAARLAARLAALPADRRDAVQTQLDDGRSGIVVTADAAAAIAFCEEVAPEHVIVHARDADGVARSLRCAGTVCIGAFTPSPAGSYVAGTNHVLPTGGAARHSAGLSVTHFVRRQSFERITREGLERLRPSIEAWSNYEGLPGHLAAIDARLRRVE